MCSTFEHRPGTQLFFHTLSFDPHTLFEQRKTGRSLNTDECCVWGLTCWTARELMFVRCAAPAVISLFALLLLYICQHASLSSDTSSRAHRGLSERRRHTSVPLCNMLRWVCSHTTNRTSCSHFLVYFLPFFCCIYFTILSVIRGINVFNRHPLQTTSVFI